MGEIWNAIVSFFNVLLQAFYDFTGNYGLAIIILTVLIKLILLPLTIKQTKSMIAMQKIQPEIKKLQEKYKDDKEKLSQEMMKFYKENKVNPLSGCLPLLLQLPVFFALYTVLRKYLLTPPTLIVGNTLTLLPAFPGQVITKSAGFLWINNLADTTRTADPTFILLILLAATTWYSQKQIMTDPRQRTLMIIMPLFTAFIGLSLPAGVVLYWVVTNILQILQQFGIEYYGKKHPEEEEKGKKAKKPTPAKEEGKKGAPVGGKEAAKTAAGGKSAAKEKPSPKAAGKGKPQPSKGGAKAGVKGQKSGAQKGTAKKGAASSGSKKSQVRRPKGPPPKQQKSQKSAKNKGSQKKK